MKKMIIPMLAVILAVATSAFGYVPGASNSQTYDWEIYVDGQPTDTFLEDMTEEEVRQDNPACDGSGDVCFRAYNSSGAPLNIYIRKD